MRFLSLRFASAAAFTAAVGNSLSIDSAAEEIITRDVCIIGGGGSGAYAAIQLKDQGHSVVVVERKDRLGGHSTTKYLPGGSHINYGVEGVFRDTVSTEFFKRLDVEYDPLLPATLLTDYVDFKTGQKVPPNNNPISTTVAVLLWRAAIEQFNFMSRGLYHLPNPIPEVLLQPLGDFVKSHALEGALNLIFQFSSNTGKMLETPLLYVLQNFGIAHLNALLGGYIKPRDGMAKLYDSAAAVLGSQNILYGTTAIEVNRTESGVSVRVQDSTTGTSTLIKAKKLLVTIPPIMANMQPFDLNETEERLFRKWDWKTYYVALITNHGIPDNFNVANLDPTQPFSLPIPPFQWELEYMGVPGYHISKIVGDRNLTQQDANNLVLADIQRMAGTYPIRDPTLVAYGDHTPTTMRVSVEDIRNGFYRDLYALQGKRSTYYTGLSFCSDYSSLIWAYTKDVTAEMFA